MALERHEDTAASPGSEMQDEDLEPRESVSDILLRAREEYGQDLRSVSDSLRIRYTYLLAIEEGRFNDLPGATYAVGFVRTYADYLGLDSEEIVRRFKAEVEGLERRTQLVFPVPKPEGRIPGGALLLISLLLVGIAYGGWYFLAQGDRSFVELLSGEETVPETELASSPEPAAPEGTTAEESMPAQDETAPAAGNQAAEDTAGVATLPPEPAVETEVLPPPEERTQVSEQDSPSENGAVAIPEPPRETAQQEEDTAPQTNEVPEAAAAEPVEPSAAIPAAPRSEQLATAPTGRVFGEAEAPVRIVLRAKQDAWVQVRDEENQLLLTEVLRSGDVYRVPDQEGLTMLTGNAGGLEITVDGKVAPTLGPIGVVRRNVALDPQRLSNGTAVGEQRNQE